MTLREAFSAYLLAHPPGIPVLAGENHIDDTPDDLTPWISVSYDTFGEEASSIGAHCFRVEGVIRINVWVASGSDESVALQHIEELRDLLRNKNIGNGVSLSTASPAELDMPSSDGNWNSWFTEVDYIHNYQRGITP